MWRFLEVLLSCGDCVGKYFEIIFTPGILPHRNPVTSEIELLLESLGR